MTNLLATSHSTNSTAFPMDAITAQSLAYCREVTRTHARNFYYGMKLTPGIKRDALYAIYAFMRACDDLVDQDPNQLNVQMGNPQELKKDIDQFRQKMQTVIDTGIIPEHENKGDSIWPAFNYVMINYPVAPQYLHDMLDGQQRDLITETFQIFDQLYDYCYDVASVVGLTCISIWGYNGGKAVQELAIKRGIAFQLTNILRDVSEDFQRGRIYLPADELKEYHVDPQVFLQANPDENFDRFMQFQIERAFGYYNESEALESHLTPDCQSTCWAMMRIYRSLLEKIANNPRCVLTQRVRLTKLAKTSIALRARFRKS
ncbi:MAG: phytoene/squalene synthase family protein [Phycisphaeraceae bacterium]|nr:phytoene/squalene synthase family protein [Phycisphaeraceae bacterium]